METDNQIAQQQQNQTLEPWKQKQWVWQRIRFVAMIQPATGIIQRPIIIDQLFSQL